MSDQPSPTKRIGRHWEHITDFYVDNNNWTVKQNRLCPDKGRVRNAFIGDYGDQITDVYISTQVPFKNNVVGDKTFSCEICNKTMTYKTHSNRPSRLAEHRRKHLLKHAFVTNGTICPICATFIKEDDLYTHFENKHPEGSTSTTVTVKAALKDEYKVIDFNSLAVGIAEKDLEETNFWLSIRVRFKLPDRPDSLFVGVFAHYNPHVLRENMMDKYNATKNPKYIFRFKAMKIRPFHRWMCIFCEEQSTCYFEQDFALRMYALLHLLEKHEDIFMNDFGSTAVIQNEINFIGAEMCFDPKPLIDEIKRRKDVKYRSIRTFYITRFTPELEVLGTEMIARAQRKWIVKDAMFCYVCGSLVNETVQTHFKLPTHTHLEAHIELSEFREVDGLDLELNEENFSTADFRYASVYRKHAPKAADSYVTYSWKCHYEGSADCGTVFEFPAVMSLRLFALRHLCDHHIAFLDAEFMAYEWNLIQHELTLNFNFASYKPTDFAVRDKTFNKLDPNFYVFAYQKALLKRRLENYKVCGFCYLPMQMEVFELHIARHHGYQDFGVLLVANHLKAAGMIAIDKNKYKPIDLSIKPYEILSAAGKKWAAELLGRLESGEQLDVRAGQEGSTTSGSAENAQALTLNDALLGSAGRADSSPTSQDGEDAEEGSESLPSVDQIGTSTSFANEPEAEERDFRGGKPRSFCEPEDEGNSLTDVETMGDIASRSPDVFNDDSWKNQAGRICKTEDVEASPSTSDVQGVGRRRRISSRIRTKSLSEKVDDGQDTAEVQAVVVKIEPTTPTTRRSARLIKNEKSPPTGTAPTLKASQSKTPVAAGRSQSRKRAPGAADVVEAKRLNLCTSPEVVDGLEEDVKVNSKADKKDARESTSERVDDGQEAAEMQAIVSVSVSTTSTRRRSTRMLGKEKSSSIGATPVGVAKRSTPNPGASQPKAPVSVGRTHTRIPKTANVVDAATMLKRFNEFPTMADLQLAEASNLTNFCDDLTLGLLIHVATEHADEPAGKSLLDDFRCLISRDLTIIPPPFLVNKLRFGELVCSTCRCHEEDDLTELKKHFGFCTLYGPITKPTVEYAESPSSSSSSMESDSESEFEGRRKRRTKANFDEISDDFDLSDEADDRPRKSAGKALANVQMLVEAKNSSKTTGQNDRKKFVQNFRVEQIDDEDYSSDERSQRTPPEARNGDEAVDSRESTEEMQINRKNVVRDVEVDDVDISDERSRRDSSQVQHDDEHYVRYWKELIERLKRKKFDVEMEFDENALRIANSVPESVAWPRRFIGIFFTTGYCGMCKFCQNLKLPTQNPGRMHSAVSHLILNHFDNPTVKELVETIGRDKEFEYPFEFERGKKKGMLCSNCHAHESNGYSEIVRHYGACLKNRTMAQRKQRKQRKVAKGMREPLLSYRRSTTAAKKERDRRNKAKEAALELGAIKDSSGVSGIPKSSQPGQIDDVDDSQVSAVSPSSTWLEAERPHRFVPMKEALDSDEILAGGIAQNKKRIKNLQEAFEVVVDKQKQQEEIARRRKEMPEGSLPPDSLTKAAFQRCQLWISSAFFTCTKCPFERSSSQAVRDHYELLHTVEGEFDQRDNHRFCHICDEGGQMTRKYLYKHIAALHRDIERPFKCFYCEECFNISKHTRYHEDRCHEAKFTRRFRCTDCGKTFYKKDYLLKHIEEHNAVKQKEHRLRGISQKRRRAHDS